MMFKHINITFGSGKESNDVILYCFTERVRDRRSSSVGMSFVWMHNIATN